jgi:hypothetical protein
MATDYSYIGIGKIYLREIGASLGFLEVGNCSALGFGVTEEEKKLKDFTEPGGGTRNSVKRIDAVTASFTMHDINANNLARALYGTVSAVATAGVVDEAHTVYEDTFVPLTFMPAASPVPTVVGAPDGVTRANSTAYALGDFIKPATPNTFFYVVTVAGTSAGSPPTFPTTIGGSVADGTATIVCAGLLAPASGTDYEVRAGGLFVLADRVFGGVPWEISYTKAATDVMNALTSSGKEYEMVFDGLNEARSGKRTRVTAYRVKPGALQNLGLIGEDYAALEVSGEVLQDTTKVGAGISKYFKAEMEV